ncbi:MAG: hypothetical protein Q9172_007559, partial [Xanthocarpia lactea]
MSPDSAAMHSAVLARAAESLHEGLSHAQRQHKNRVDISPLLETLRPYLTNHREKAAALAELEAWTRTSPNGLSTAMGNTIQTLINWVFANSNTPPPNYTHRLLLQTQRMLGAETTLKTLIDETMNQVNRHGINAQEVDTIFDIIVTMITAPQTERRSFLSMKDALRIQLAEINELSKTDIPRATIIVRLHRRVEALVAATITATTADMNANDNDMNLDM